MADLTYPSVASSARLHHRMAPPMIRLALSSPTSTAGRRAPGRPLFRWSLSRSCLSTSASEDQSTIVGGPSLLTQTGVHRPSPSLFYLPGLRSVPFWTAPTDPDNSSKLRFAFNDRSIKHAVEHVESNYESIRAEYFGAVLGQRKSTDHVIAKPLEPDYDLANKGGEHADGALHSGKWRLIAVCQANVLDERFRNSTTCVQVCGSGTVTSCELGCYSFF